MKLPQDLKLHLIFGIMSVIGAFGITWVYDQWGLGATVAAAATLVGVVNEIQQKVRNDGVMSGRDALFTAIPGWATWGVMELAKVVQQGQTPVS